MPNLRTAVIVEDDADTRDLIQLILSQSGFVTVLAQDSDTAIKAIREHHPLLTTLDVNIPGIDGFAVAKRVREFSQTYMIMITSLDEEIDVVRGFEAGADDYLVKPFRPRELRARAEAMLRRSAYASGARGDAPSTAPSALPAAEPESWAAAAARELRENVAVHQDVEVEPPPAPTPAPAHRSDQPPVQQAAARAVVPDADAGPILRHGSLVFDTTAGGASLGGRRLDLSAPEAEVLLSLMRTGRRVRSKADLVLVLRGQQYVTSHFVNEADKRAIDAHVATIRRKLGDDAPVARYIETVRGVGYRMAETT